MAVGKRQFKNQSDGAIGVIVVVRGTERGISVAPGQTVFLTQDEIELTRDAPESAGDNPFAPQPYVERNPDTDEVTLEGQRPILIEVHEPRGGPDDFKAAARATIEEVGTEVPPSRLAAVGSFAEGEEV